MEREYRGYWYRIPELKCEMEEGCRCCSYLTVVSVAYDKVQGYPPGQYRMLERGSHEKALKYQGDQYRLVIRGKREKVLANSKNPRKKQILSLMPWMERQIRGLERLVRFVSFTFNNNFKIYNLLETTAFYSNIIITTIINIW